MAQIDLKKVNMTALRNMANALNATKFLDTALVTRVGVKKADLAASFVKGIVECHEKGKLDDVPDEVYNYYLTIVPPKEDGDDGEAQVPDDGAVGASDEGGEAEEPTNEDVAPKAAPKGRGTAKAPAKEAAPKGRGTAKAKPKAPAKPKVPRTTRSKVFADILMGTKKKMLTKQEIVDALMNGYQGRAKGDAEAKFWTTAYLRLADDLGLIEAREDDKIKYIG